MKELSIEEKAKRYDDAIEVAQRFYNNSVAITKKGLEDIFPELKESEDEKIRKEILDFCKNRAEKYPNDPKYKNISAWIAWLEKQGEQKSNPVLDIEIPFGAKDSELQEASYYIPEGFHAEIESNRVVIKRGEQKPAWSEEDEDKIQIIINIIKDSDPDWEGLIKWLKSLRPQSHWKPSEKQLEALQKECIAHSNYDLCRLLEDLKKLTD